MGQRFEQANKQAVDAYNTDFEVKKLRLSSKDKVQILKAILN